MRPELYLSVPMSAASVDSKGRMLYQDRKGYENLYRKHERSSGTSDIWMYDGGRFSKLTDFNGHDLNPVWAADGNSFYFISEQDGTLNVYKSSADGRARRSSRTSTAIRCVRFPPLPTGLWHSAGTETSTRCVKAHSLRSLMCP